MNLSDTVREHAGRRPDAVAVIEPAAPGSDRRETTWAQLEAAVADAAALLTEWGLRAPQRVLLHGENSLAMVVAHLACLRTGTVSTPVNPQATPAELRATAELTGASLLLSDDPAGAGEVAGGLLDVRSLTDVLGTPTAPQTVAAPVDPEALAVLVQTSGSVRHPQVVMLSHRAVSTSVSSVARASGLDGSSVVLALLPFFHVFGLNAVLGTSLAAGARLVVLPGLRPDLLDVIRAEGVTELPLTPTVMFRLLQLPGVDVGLRGLDRVLSAGAPLSTALAREFARVTGVRVDQAYGLTEAAPGVCTTLGQPELISGAHVGVPLPGVEVRIGGVDDGGPGEVQVRGDHLFSGYWPDGHGAPGPDGWWSTGDLGYLADGQLFLAGRLREVVIVAGFNVYPSEVEEALMEHPAVHAAAVIGHGDEQTGESLVAFVSVAPGRSGLSVGELQRHVSARLARYKCPSEIYVLERMPRSITGKIRKQDLRDLVDALEEEQ
ncbi:class I adenylate-forming enzyme family protein [Desertihabitans brevis]|uniref:class I adenylate-forming enzyme family protein n=1 Tax=Desertihabitans brevis TaxID=2268447 RepID=UPI00131492B7|nr:class I adenylate-forming enzyme family protein [Desertihabitans brevis]